MLPLHRMSPLELPRPYTSPPRKACKHSARVGLLVDCGSVASESRKMSFVDQSGCWRSGYAGVGRRRPGAIDCRAASGVTRWGGSSEAMIAILLDSFASSGSPSGLPQAAITFRPACEKCPYLTTSRPCPQMGRMPPRTGCTQNLSGCQC